MAPFDSGLLSRQPLKPDAGLVSHNTAALPERKIHETTNTRLKRPERRDNGSQLTPAMPTAQITRWADLFGARASDSREVVTPVTAMQTATMNACVRLISQCIAAMNPILYDKAGNGKQEAFDNYLHDVLAVEPNPDSSAFTLWESFVASILLTGNGYRLCTSWRRPARERRTSSEISQSLRLS